MERVSHHLTRFLVIFGLVFLLEVPGCVIVCADDAGQINYFEHKALIEASKNTFAAPLVYVTRIPTSWGQLLLIYIGNLLILSVSVLLVVNGIKYLRVNFKKQVSIEES